MSVLALGSSGSTTLLFNVLVARAMGPTGFGEVARTFAVAMAAAQIPMAGVTPAVGRHIAALEASERPAAARGALRFGLAGGIVAAGLFLVCAATGVCSANGVLVLGGASLAAVYPIYFNQKIVMFALDEIVEYAALEIGADVVFFAALAASVTLGHPRLALCMFGLAYGLFCVVGAQRIARRSRRVGRIPVNREFARFSGLSFVSTYSSVGRFPLLIVVASAVGGSVVAGLVSPAIAIATPLMLVPQAAGLLAFVDSARARTAGADEEIRRLGRIVAFAGIAGVAVVLAGGAYFARLLLGSRFGGVELMVVSAGLLPLILGTTSANALAGRGRIGTTTLISMTSLLVGIVITWAATRGYGAVGAAVGIAVACALTGVGNLRAAGRALSGVPWEAAAFAAGVGTVVPAALGASGQARLLSIAGLLPFLFVGFRRSGAKLG